MKGLLLLYVLVMSVAVHADDTLKLSVDNKEISIPYQDWNSKYKSLLKDLSVKDHPNYEKEISYTGVSFKNFIGSRFRAITYEDVIVITCTDGYRPVLEGEIFRDGKAFLAIREKNPKQRVTNDGRWTKVKMEDEYVTPGPFYLVWPSQKEHKHSWPYQIQSIEIKKKKSFNEFSKIQPKLAEAKKGFEIFKKKCLKCHSIKYTGPKGKAPDLAYVTGYRTHSYIKNRIRKGRGKMPPFSKGIISDSDIEEVLKYLKAIYDQY